MPIQSRRPSERHPLLQRHMPHATQPQDIQSGESSSTKGMPNLRHTDQQPKSHLLRRNLPKESVTRHEMMI